MLKWALVISLIFNFGFTQTPRAIEKPQAERLLQDILEKAPSIEQLIFLGALAGAKADFLKEVREDAAALPSKPWPQLKIEKHEIVLNGRATGIWIDSKGPLRLAFHGNSWTFDSKASFEKNYKSLQKFLKSSSVAGSINPWMANANAAWSDRDLAGVAGIAVCMGIVIAGSAALLFLTATGGILVPVVMSVGLVAGAHVGSIAGEKVYDYRKIRQELFDLTSSTDIEIKCDSAKAFIKIKNKKGKITDLEFSKEEKKILLSYDGQKSSRQILSTQVEFSKYPYAQMMECKTEDQARQIAADFKEKMLEAKKALEPSGSASPTSSSTSSVQ